jgi:hypothetical protein
MTLGRRFAIEVEGIAADAARLVRSTIQQGRSRIRSVSS